MPFKYLMEVQTDGLHWPRQFLQIKYRSGQWRTGELVGSKISKVRH